MNRRKQMIEMIETILEKHSEIQTNIGSPTARNQIATDVVNKLSGINDKFDKMLARKFKEDTGIKAYKIQDENFSKYISKKFGKINDQKK